jgi:hypothetical protein
LRSNGLMAFFDGFDRPKRLLSGHSPRQTTDKASRFHERDSSMREFFRGWKRKVGVITLVLACMFAGGWKRGLAAKEVVRLCVADELTYFFVSNGSWLYWQGVRGKPELNTPKAIGDIRVGPVYFSTDVDNGDYRYVLQAEQRSFYPEEKRYGYRITSWAIPYWSIVLPLTAISTWLLLSKPRPVKPPAIETVEYELLQIVAMEDWHCDAGVGMRVYELLDAEHVNDPLPLVLGGQQLVFRNFVLRSSHRLQIRLR